jgi:hypothetical protein
MFEFVTSTLIVSFLATPTSGKLFVSEMPMGLLSGILIAVPPAAVSVNSLVRMPIETSFNASPGSAAGSMAATHS